MRAASAASPRGGGGRRLGALEVRERAVQVVGDPLDRREPDQARHRSRRPMPRPARPRRRTRRPASGRGRAGCRPGEQREGEAVGPVAGEFEAAFRQAQRALVAVVGALRLGRGEVGAGRARVVGPVEVLGAERRVAPVEPVRGAAVQLAPPAPQQAVVDRVADQRVGEQERPLALRADQRDARRAARRCESGWPRRWRSVSRSKRWPSTEAAWSAILSSGSSRSSLAWTRLCTEPGTAVLRAPPRRGGGAAPGTAGCRPRARRSVRPGRRSRRGRSLPGRALPRRRAGRGRGSAARPRCLGPPRRTQRVALDARRRDQDRRAPGDGGAERGQVRQRRPVRPVEVLDHEQARAGAARPLDQARQDAPPALRRGSRCPWRRRARAARPAAAARAGRSGTPRPRQGRGSSPDPGDSSGGIASPAAPGVASSPSMPRTRAGSRPARCRSRNRAPARRGRRSRPRAPPPGTPRPGASCRSRPRRGRGWPARGRSRGRRRGRRGTGPARRSGRRAARGRARRAAGRATATPAPARRSPSPRAASSSSQASRSPSARRTASETRISPARAASVRREARFTDWPVTVYSRWLALPVPLATTWPPATPDVHAQAAPDLGGDRRHGVADGQRGAHRPLGVVAVGQRRAEHRHDAVADVLVDPAAVLLDQAVDALEEAAEQRVHLLGVELAAQRRVAGEVREEHRHLRRSPSARPAGARRWPRLRPPAARRSRRAACGDARPPPRRDPSGPRP